MPKDFKSSLLPIFISSMPKDVSSVESISICFLEQAINLKPAPNGLDDDHIQAFFKGVIETPPPIDTSLYKAHQDLFTKEKFNHLIKFIRLTRACNIKHAENHVKTAAGEIAFLGETKRRLKLLSYLLAMVYMNPNLELTSSKGYSLLMAIFSEDTLLLLETISDGLYCNRYPGELDALHTTFEKSWESTALLISEMLKIKNPNTTHFSIEDVYFTLSLCTFTECKYYLGIKNRQKTEESLKHLQTSMESLTPSGHEVIRSKMIQLKTVLQKTEQKTEQKSEQKSDLETKSEPPAKKKKKKQKSTSNEKLRTELATLKKQEKQAIKPSSNIALLNEKTQLEEEATRLNEQLTQVDSSKAEKIKAFEETIAKLKREEAEFRNQTKSLEQQRQRQKQQEKEAAKRAETQQKTLQGLQKEVGDCESLLAQLEKMLAEKSATLKKYQTPTLVPPTAEDRSLAEKREKKRALEQAIQKLETENNKIAEQCQTSQTKIDALKAHIESLKVTDQKQRANYLAQAQATCAQLCAPPVVVYQYPSISPVDPNMALAPTVYQGGGYNISPGR